jgi:hypothetical protein
MNGDGVYPGEMDDPHDLDDATADALLSGDLRSASPQLADFVGDVRIAYTSTPAASAEIAALMGASPPVPPPSFISRRFERMRSSMLAKIGAGAAVVVAATGGLAAAHALPASVQDAVSHLAIGTSHESSGAPSVEESTTSTTLDSTVTTMPNDTTPTTAEHPENHGGEVSAIAHDHSADGCEHGAAVSAVASDGKAHNDADDASEGDAERGSCETTTTIEGTTPTTVDDNDADEQGENHQSGDNHDGKPPTVGGGGTTGSSESRDGGHNDGANNGGDVQSSGSDRGDSSGSGGGD